MWLHDDPVLTGIKILCLYLLIQATYIINMAFCSTAFQTFGIPGRQGAGLRDAAARIT